MENKSSPIEARSFTAGVLVSFFIVFFIALFLLLILGSRVGYENLYIKMKHAVLPHTAVEAVQQKTLYLPEDILKELTRLEAVVDNANNPTNSKRHDTILVHPDNNLGYVLNSNSDITAFVMKTGEAVNLDAPVLYINSDVMLSHSLKNYIDNYSRLSYRYTTTSDGYRNTVPETRSDSKILMVGDSVAFGVGVNDDATAASHLQRLAGETYSVLNAGVGGYASKQALKIATTLSSESKYDYLIYLTSQNDFPIGGKYRPDNVEKTLKQFALLKDSFPMGVVIAVFPYMEYSLSDVLLDTGYSSKRLVQLDMIYSDLIKYSEKYGLTYIDLKNMSDIYIKNTGTIFSRFALYADHAHLSPLANRMVAEKIYINLIKFNPVNSTSGSSKIAE